MKTNHLMLKDLLSEYHPERKGFISDDEYKLVKETLCIDEMDILQLRNLRDFTVLHMSRLEGLENWDKMSAITYVIDLRIFELGGEV